MLLRAAATVGISAATVSIPAIVMSLSAAAATVAAMAAAMAAARVGAVSPPVSRRALSWEPPRPARIPILPTRIIPPTIHPDIAHTRLTRIVDCINRPEGLAPGRGRGLRHDEI